LGDQIEICDYEKEYTCEIVEIDNHVTCKIIDEKVGNRESNLEITLFQGLPKLDKMDWIIQKTTELGAFRVVPVNTRRSIMKVKKSSKIERWNKVAFSAAQQSKRMRIPIVDEPIDINHLLDRYGSQLDALVVPYENQDGRELKNQLAKLVGYKRIGILIGPEGGLDEADLQAVQSDKTYLVSLGKRILRTETAAITSVGIIQYELGDLGE
jgi:16S rRNA (uracil1498-N3)-methyltransferase